MSLKTLLGYGLPDFTCFYSVASLVLHNMLRTNSRDSYTPPETFDAEIDGNTAIPGSWREDGGSEVLFDSPQSRQNNHYSRNMLFRSDALYKTLDMKIDPYLP